MISVALYQGSCYKGCYDGEEQCRNFHFKRTLSCFWQDTMLTYLPKQIILYSQNMSITLIAEMNLITRSPGGKKRLTVT